MASNPKLDSSSSSPDGVPYGSQRSIYSNSSNLERSGTSQDGHDGRLGIGTGAGGAAGNSSGAGTGIELPPLSQVLSLEPLSAEDPRAGRHSELKRAINAARGSIAENDPSLGSVQSKQLQEFGPEELKRVKASLLDYAKRSRERGRHLSEAISKLDRLRNSLQSRKRSRPDSSAPGPPGPSAERSLASLGVGERTVASLHNMKGNSNAAPPHGSAADSALQKAVDKNKRVVPNKRVRTSMADARPEGRSANVSLQRPSISTDREREISRPSTSLPSPAEERERAVAPPSEGWEKTKMKGRRSGTVTKVELSAAALANGTPEGDREHKWSGQQHRMSTDSSRPRPSEGHGFRSGPVHGITSVHKAESSAQLNGLPMRGGLKGESEGALAANDRAERVSVPDRERNVSKNGVKPPSIREESHTSTPTGITKTKAARAPRSSSSAGGPSSHLARSSSFADNRERHAPPAKSQVPTQVQVPSGTSNRKRPAPSRSSSPPAQWVGQRPPKMARVARRGNLMPGAASSREDSNVSGEGLGVTRDGVGTNVGARSNPGLLPGPGVARRVSASSMHSHPPNKPKIERVTTSVGLSESDESEDDGEKVKEKAKKQGDWEQKPVPPIQKMASLVVPAKKTRVVTKEEGGDGVRRQGRSGRGAVAPRTSVVNPVEKVEVSANAKQLRSVRVGPEKQERVGRPPTKKDVVDRKPMTRPRRPLGNGLSEISGESDDDREELANAIRIAVNASGVACSNSFWKQMEPYFAFLTAADVGFIQQQTRDLVEGDPALQSPACGDQYGKMELIRSTPPISPVVDAGGGGKSMSLANGNVENDVYVTKLFHNMKEKLEVGKGGRRGVNGGWFDKIIPMSQRLLAALVNEGDVDDGRRGSEENCQDDSSEGPRDESPFRGSMSGSERLDGDSDGDIGRCELERWNSGGRETYASEGLLVPNGHSSRSGMNLPREDLGVEGDDILVNVEAYSVSAANQLEVGNGDEVLVGSNITGKEDQRGIRSSGTVAGMTAWEIQYQRSSVDERILLELQSVGLFPEPLQSDLAQREDDEISEELRKMQRELRDQVFSNKERVTALETTVVLKKEIEERERERFAVEKLVEIAYSRRMGSRGSSGGKSAAAKGAKTAGLAFAKRVLTRVRAFEGGHSCFDAALRDLLFCVAPKESESSMALSGGLESVAPAVSLTGDASAVTSAALQPPKTAATLSGEGLGVRPVVRRADVKSEKDIPEVRQQPILQLADRSRGKEDGWPLRPKEREALLEDVGGVSGMRDVNALGSNVMGGTKGKRSERERDGKGHGKESHTRSDSSKGARQGVKSERKTKTKPRQKTAPLSKAVNDLLAKPTPELVKDRSTSTSASQQFIGLVKSKEEVAVIPPLVNQSAVPDTDEVVDLSNIPIPGIEDLGVNDLGGQGQDLGSWLQDFEEDVHMHQDGNCLMGLEVPMDDLSDLGLMM